MNQARYREGEKVTTTGNPGRDRGRLRQVGQCFLALLVVGSMIVMLGCGDDDSGDEGIPVDARISDPGSVFGLFAQAGESGFTFPSGLFGPNSQRSVSPTVLSFSDVIVQGTQSTARFRTAPSDPSESEGEGDSDGGASCNYRYDPETRRIPCPLCDFVCTADNIEPGTEGPGECLLQLAGTDTPETRANPTFQSTPFPATIGLDEAGMIIRVNGVSVVPES